MLAGFFSQTTVGYYALTYRLVGLPVTLIGRAIGSVFLQRVSEMRSNQDYEAGYVELVFRRLVALGLPCALLITFGGRELAVAILGQDWAETGTYVQLMGPWAFFWFVYAPLSTMFVVLERQELFLAGHIAVLVIRFIALYAGGVTGSAYLTVGLFAGSGVLSYGGLTLWSLALAGVSVRSALRILLHQGLYCIPAVVALVLLRPWLRAATGPALALSAVALLITTFLSLHQDPALYGYVKSVFRTRHSTGSRNDSNT